MTAVYNFYGSDLLLRAISSLTRKMSTSSSVSWMESMSPAELMKRLLMDPTMKEKKAIPKNSRKMVNKYSYHE